MFVMYLDNFFQTMVTPGLKKASWVLTLLSIALMSAAQTTEDISKRTTNSRTTIQPDGAIRIEYCSQPIHYYDEHNQLQPIVTDFQKTIDGWSAMQQPHPVHVNNEGVITTNYGLYNANQYGINRIFNGLSLSITDIEKIDYHLPFGTHAACNLAQDNALSSANPPACNITWPDALAAATSLSNVRLIIEPRQNGVKYQYELSEAPALNETQLIISEETYFDAGTLMPYTGHGKYKNGLWYGHMLVVNENGETTGYIQGTTCYDANGQSHLAAYSWEQLGKNKYRLSTHIETSWLHSPTTEYPVVIDPLVIGPTADFGNNWMPSCYIPEYNADSIYVTIPGELTVTAFFITSHFFADPFAGSVMGDGAMYFSTPCATTGNYEVQGAPGDTAGTAYLYMENLRVPLTCCYPQSCSDQSFWLTMHLGRYLPAGGCDTLNIYYSPVTLWPFTAYIEGHTVESFASQFTVQNAPICSNECMFDATIRARYGVPPYTFTHIWTSQTYVNGEPDGCDFGNVVQHLDLNVPGCPIYCPTFDQLVVPPATITDACGNTVDNLPVDLLNLKPAPDLTTPPQPFYVCSGVEETAVLNSCLQDAVINWNGTDQSGTGNLAVLFENTGNNSISYNYTVQATHDGCSSDVINFEVIVLPNPLSNFNHEPVPAIVSNPVFFFDASTSSVDDIEEWMWEIGNYISNEQDFTVTFDSVGLYNACLTVNTEHGCVHTLCKDLWVISNLVAAPNIFTPNNDGKNDVLKFWYLDFFPDNHLKIWNRWGNLIYEQDGYRNNWTGENYPDGTYYYLLHVSNGQVLEGYFQLLRDDN